MNFLMLIMLTINPAVQSDKLFVANDSLFNIDSIIDLYSCDGWRFHPGDGDIPYWTTFTIELPITKNQ